MATLFAVSGCTSGAGGAAVRQPSEPVPVSHEQAVAVLRQTVERAVSADSAAKFCVVAYQQGPCEDTWETAAQECLRPGGMPRVVRSADVPATVTGHASTDGGRVLLLKGRTAGGSSYVSEFFVTGAEGRPMASVGVYWSGLGLGGSPLGDDVTVIPRPECA
ncbi:hypothetical protein ACIBI4_10645 [Streptomyces sp. NPDC050418]|uniref:hypothetical protein n=1 Tax=Streptomyces sp. NPDC050418 TaxID=3365612 RepID=UPI00379B5E4C